MSAQRVKSPHDDMFDRRCFWCLGFGSILFAVAVRAMRHGDVCTWELHHPGSAKAFKATPVGWSFLSHSYWGWYDDPKDGLVIVGLGNLHKVQVSYEIY